MADITKWITKASQSQFYLYLLNIALWRMVPFNKPHRIRVQSITPDSVHIVLPYKRKNMNHIRGLHACALATVSEYATGLVLLSKLDGKKYRLIMQRMEMDYHFQGKMDAIASFAVTDEWMQEQVYLPLKDREAIVVVCRIMIHDQKGNHLTTGNIHWQIKDWEQVKTRVS